MLKLFLALVLVSFEAFAGEIQIDVFGRSYVNSCGYYSNESADLSINFTNRMLPWGTKVTVVSGWRGYDLKFISGPVQEQWFEWAYRSEQEAKAVAPYQWRAEISRTLHDRSSTQQLTALQFSIQVEEPGKAPVNYPLINWAFYEAAVGGNGNSPCVSGELPPFRLLSHRIVERN